MALYGAGVYGQADVYVYATGLMSWQRHDVIARLNFRPVEVAVCRTPDVGTVFGDLDAIKCGDIH